MHKFFVEKNQIQKDNIYIRGKDVKHIRDVLRLDLGDEVYVSCQGINYHSSIEELLKDEISLHILSQSTGENEPKVKISLYQGLAKGSKMDFIIQKGTEIGISKFFVVSTARSIVKIKDSKKEEARISRFQSIGEEAAKQCKRDHIPQVNGILSFKEMIQVLKGEKNILVAYEDEDHVTIGQALKENHREEKIHLIIGPEGGFTAEEIQGLKDIGARIVTLGPRILRTETAGFVAATIILYDLGDLGVI